MQLEEFYDYKNQLVKDMLTNEQIVRLINEDTRPELASSLVYTQVFPYEHIPDTVEEGKTYVCCDVDIQMSQGKTYLFPTLYIWVFTHQSLMRLPGGGVRVDKLCSEICKVINGSRNYGLGELNLYAAKRFAPMTDFVGKVLVFHATDISRFFDAKKPFPANRKDV